MEINDTVKLGDEVPEQVTGGTETPVESELAALITKGLCPFCYDKYHG